MLNVYLFVCVCVKSEWLIDELWMQLANLSEQAKEIVYFMLLICKQLIEANWTTRALSSNPAQSALQKGEI